MPQLRLHSPAFIPGLGSDLPIPGDDVTVGRSPDNQLVIPEASVSAHHARIQHTPAGWLLTDLGDSNGIWVGVRRVSELQLTAGQLFRIGGVALEFVDDGQTPILIDEKVNPDGPFSGSSITRGSGVRQTDASLHDAILHELGVHSDPTQVNPPDWELPTDPEPPRQSSSPVRLAPPSSRRRKRTRRLAAGLLGLTVLGFAVTLGAVFALRWLTKVRYAPRRAAPAATSAPSASNRAQTPPVLPEITLADRTVDALDIEQRIELAGLLNLQLPARALRKTTHIVIARAPALGVEFCGATQAVSNPIEIATAYNAHWAEPATLELTVDVEQLAKSGVPAVAVGFRDAAEQAWHLLPTAYDSERRVARVQIWQPGFVGLFFFNGPEVFSASEHFALLRQPKPGAPSAPGAAERPDRALGQLESALSEYRRLGFRIPDGQHFVCASQSTPPKSTALMPVFGRRELTRTHSHALARAAFVSLVPAYLDSGSMRGREFWFSAMFDALASQVSGARTTPQVPSFKRLANPLIAEDWPSPPLFLTLLSRLGDPSPDLFRIWTDTTHVMTELDAKSGNEAQSPVLAVDLALQEITKKSLLEHHTGLVTERLLSEQGRSLEQLRSHDVCAQVTHLAADARSGSANLEVPSSFTARWSCVVIEPKSNGTRIMSLRLASDPPGSLSVRLLRLGSGRALEPGPTAGRAVRFEVRSSEVLVLSAVNANMGQSASLGLKLEDVTPTAALTPAEAASARVGQEVQTTLSLSGVPEDLKTVLVQWEFGDGSPKVSSEWTVNASGTLRVAQTHAWPREGSYTLRAVVSDVARPTSELVVASRNVTVQSTKLELSTTPSNPAPQTDVKLHAKASGPLPDSVAYRFDFGDGSGPTTVSLPEATHQYARPGEYAVAIELLAGPGSSDVLATARTTLSIRSGETPPNGANPTAQVGSPAPPGADVP
jgi:hypothetical protein